MAFTAYQNASKMIFNENTEELVEYYKEERLRQTERSLQAIIRSLCLYLTTLDDNKRYTQNTLRGILTVLEQDETDKICGIAWLLLLTQKACVPLIVWSKLDSPTAIMAALKKHSPAPTWYMTEDVLDASALVQIGLMIIKQPSERAWKMATKIFDHFTAILVDITYTAYLKFYNGVIRWKAQYAVKVAQHTKETIDTKRGLARYMHHAKNIKQKVDFSTQRKAIIQATLRKVNKQIEAPKSRVDILQETQTQAQFKSRSNNNNNNKKKKKKKSQGVPVPIEIEAFLSLGGNESLRDPRKRLNGANKEKELNGEKLT